MREHSSQSIREWALAANAAGQIHTEVARSYGIDITTFQRWLRRQRETGQTALQTRGHRPAGFDFARLK